MPQIGPVELLIVFGVAAAWSALFVWAIIQVARALFGPRRRLEAEMGLEVLGRRLARGEISRAEFDQAKHALGL